MLAAIVIYTKKTAKNTGKYLRLIASAIPLFHGFGRIGCFLTGCCYGKTISPHWHLFGLELDRIPVQLIEASFEFLLFILLLYLSRKKPQINGVTVYIIVYACFRFTIEFFRGDTVRGIFLGLSTSQWISLAIILVIVVRSVVNGKSIWIDTDK